MKQIISLLLAAVFLLSAAACSREGTDVSLPETTPAPSTEPPATAESTATADPPATADPEPSLPPEEGLELLSVGIATESAAEWAEFVPLCQAVWSVIVLGEESAQLYPELVKVLERNNAVTREYGEDFVRENHEWAREMAAENEYFYGLTWKDKYLIQRADEHILSIRGNWSAYTGGVHPNYGVYGMNIDPESGEDVLLSDILTETDGLTDILANKLLEKYPDVYLESLPEMLADYELENYSWTLNYQGLTFYFSPYEIASYAAGLLTVTIWFDEAPQLFREEYTRSPEHGYAIALPTAFSTEFDLDPSDGKRDEISVSCVSVDGTGMLQPIISRNGEQFSDADGYMYELQAYLVHTNGKSYIYLEGVIENDYRTISVYDLNSADIVVSGHVYGSGFNSFYYEDGEHRGHLTSVFNDPENFSLETRLHILGTLQGVKKYRVRTSDGMPEEKTFYYALDPNSHPLTSIIPIKVEILPEGNLEELSSGTRFRFLRTDGESYVDMLLDDGRECRIHVEHNSDTWEWYINGISERDCFDALLYAG